MLFCSLLSRIYTCHKTNYIWNCEITHSFAGNKEVGSWRAGEFKLCRVIWTDSSECRQQGVTWCFKAKPNFELCWKSSQRSTITPAMTSRSILIWRSIRLCSFKYSICHLNILSQPCSVSYRLSVTCIHCIWCHNNYKWSNNTISKCRLCHHCCHFIHGLVWCFPSDLPSHFFIL